MSCTESNVDHVVETIDEIEQNTDVCDMAESNNEPTNDTREPDEICSKCEEQTNKVIKLQKRIRWLKKSKQKLNNSLNVV